MDPGSARLAVASLGITAMVLASCRQAPQPPSETEQVDTQAESLSGAPEPLAELRRGMNVLYYDPGWGERGPIPLGDTVTAAWRFQQSHFEAIRGGGFDFVRVNLRAFPHMAVDYDYYTMDAEYGINPAFLELVDWVVNSATEAGLSVILDGHDYEVCGESAALCRQRLLFFWGRIASRYQDAPPSVLFELLNEPLGELDVDTWNALFPEILAVVRETNPTRRVIIGSVRWSDFSTIPTLELPEGDPNIIATFHYYHPTRFTAQGNPRVSRRTGVTWGSDADRAQIASDFDTVAEWSRLTGRQVLLGEFGVASRVPMDLRVDWTAAVAREAERRGFAWAYWAFHGSRPAWDADRDGWVEEIHGALIPRTP
ncbi:MAG: glycoside hydrolase family 5 protein [Gemmatimonadota bacterium]